KVLRMTPSCGRLDVASNVSTVLLLTVFYSLPDVDSRRSANLRWPTAFETSETLKPETLKL
ncbi:MAG TPA: hypothetical protein VI424_03985, partial [Terriglobales bacterium]